MGRLAAHVEEMRYQYIYIYIFFLPENLKRLFRKPRRKWEDK
jgi:hypothetical protein